MKVLAALQADSRPPGTYVIGPATLDYPTTVLTVAVSRAGLPDTPNVLAKVVLEYRTNGQVWLMIGDGDLVGGVERGRRNRIVEESIYTFQNASEYAEGLEVRATLTVLSEITTAVEIRAGEVPERLTTRGPLFREPADG